MTIGPVDNASNNQPGFNLSEEISSNNRKDKLYLLKDRIFVGVKAFAKTFFTLGVGLIFNYKNVRDDWKSFWTGKVVTKIDPNSNITSAVSSIIDTPVKQKSPLNNIIQILESKVVHSYTGDLTLLQKSKIEANFINDDILQIGFKEVSNLNVTIRQADIFDSQAQVIINAANIHLSGGGGIDGEIHKKGGPKYKAVHQELQKLYKSTYISGHAAMIESGSLKETYNIQNVIVVAGPQGKTNSEKESELYSCYYNSLLLAENFNKISVAFPSISTGIFGFPKDRAAHISLKAIYDFIEQYPNTKLKNISIHFLPNNSKINLELYKKIFDYTEQQPAK